ncbi:MAG TPA: DUF72 domain-containing protein [Myxococcaceae bacterium]|nr:DUF72 domain-containing protein [Myxococcaceae bacterium]
MRKVKVGLCGWTVAIASYPHYFPVVEVQQTFYEPPGDTTMLRWRESMPEGFEFTLKAWQLITHTSTSSTYRRLKRVLTPEERAEVGGFKPTAIVDEGWRRSVQCARLLGATAILFQCPASFRPTPDNITHLRAFFERIERPEGIRLLWEPRGEWPEAKLRKLCGDLGLVHVVDPFVNRIVTRDPTYYRLHGITGSRHVYKDHELRKLLGALPDKGEAYVMFNNIPRAADARRFQQLVGETDQRQDFPPARP